MNGFTLDEYNNLIIILFISIINKTFIYVVIPILFILYHSLLIPLITKNK